MKYVVIATGKNKVGNKIQYKDADGRSFILKPGDPVPEGACPKQISESFWQTERSRKQ